MIRTTDNANESFLLHICTYIHIHIHIRTPTHTHVCIYRYAEVCAYLSFVSFETQGWVGAGGSGTERRPENAKN